MHNPAHAMTTSNNFRNRTVNLKHSVNDSMNDSLAIYERIAELTTRILQAARAKDWPWLAELEADCAAEAEKITQHPHEPLTGAALQRKISSIHKILADDREIRDLMNPWMVRLTAILDGKTPTTDYKFSKPPSR